jgi:hypothetical protein
MDSVAERLTRAGSFAPDRAENTIDAAFILDQGWITDFGKDESFQSFDRNGNRLVGWQAQGSAATLMDLLTWLSSVMPRVSSTRPLLLRYTLPKK